MQCGRIFLSIQVRFALSCESNWLFSSCRPLRLPIPFSVSIARAAIAKEVYFRIDSVVHRVECSLTHIGSLCITGKALKRSYSNQISNLQSLENLLKRYKRNAADGIAAMIPTLVCTLQMYVHAEILPPESSGWLISFALPQAA